MYCATRPLNNTRHRPLCINRTYNHRSHSSRSNNYAGSSMGSTHQCTSTKPRKRCLPDDMAFFVPPNKINQFLAAPSGSLRSKRSTSRFPNGDIDISSDLEISFASNVSLNSPPRNNISLASECEPMDISPAPPVKPPAVSTFESGSTKPARPRAFTSGARLFGADISNGSNQAKCLMPTPSVGQNPPLGTVLSNSKKIQRSALPTEWLASSPCSQVALDLSLPADEPMDVDTSYNIDTVLLPALNPVLVSPVPNSAAPTITGFNQLFYGTLSPGASFGSPVGHQPKKQRRSLSPSSARRTIRVAERDLSSPPTLQSSPSEAKLERIATKATLNAHPKPGLQGLGAPSAGFLKRPRRPVLSAMVGSSDHLQAQSAYPTMSAHDFDDDDNSPRGSAPVRRAFSAFLPPSSLFTLPVSASVIDEHHHLPEDELSFENEGISAEMSSPAQAYSKRQQVKTIRRCDGTEDFRPLTGATALKMKESPFGGNPNNHSPSSRFMVATGLPGFGDNEAHGKILPCHRVTEDGLMRIKPQTLDHLLDGRYDHQIVDFHIIDCRFDYEYDGGHIPGAANINTTSAVEELLLGPSLTKPRPSVSGDNTKKTVLIFHCEFSAKRAPTFAKQLRAKDRALNNHIYPKIHYPEVYILEGGYCEYFKISGHRCEPPSYVAMDDPNHASSRREDLDQFRKAKFGRHKSYAYGDGKGLPFGQQQQLQPKRNTAPQSLFAAAATAARSRRILSSGAGFGGLAGTNSAMNGGMGNGAKALSTLVEDGNVTADTDDTDTELGDSPCPPPTKATMMTKAKKLTARGMVRSETYGPSRMNY